MNNFFYYENKQLHIENVNIKDLVKKYGTPFYVYSYNRIKKNFLEFETEFQELNPLICYAVKASSNLAILNLLAMLGAGADCVSQGEIERAIAANIPPEKIVFSGVGKTEDELEFALKNNILQINIESEAELTALNKIAQNIGIKANIALRVNPDVEAGTHANITTGKTGNKFGIDYDLIAPLIAKLETKYKNINLQSISVHIGSQLLSIEPFKQAFIKIADLIDELKSKGLKIENVDIGGGLGITYNDEVVPSINEYKEMVKSVFASKNLKIIMEPGRRIVGNSAILVTKLLYKKTSGDKNFLVVDAGMNDLMRPCLYDAYHQISPVTINDSSKIKTFDIVGPVCESTDFFAKNREFPDVEEGSYLSIFNCGAYGATMSSSYNTRPLIAEIIVNGSDHDLIRKRPSFKEIIKDEFIPGWITNYSS